MSSNAPACPARSAALSMSRSAVLCQGNNARQFIKVFAVVVQGPLEEVIAQGLLEEATVQEDQVAQVQRSMGMEKDLQMSKDQVAHMAPQEAATKVQVGGPGEAQVAPQNPVEEVMVAVRVPAEEEGVTAKVCQSSNVALCKSSSAGVCRDNSVEQ